MGLGDCFIDVQTLPDGAYGFVQLMSLMVGYAYILFIASNMISNGSELLLLVPSLAGIVGSCVLPVLGAVPDGAIVLFSGLGPDAQEQLDVGVGALAGSTIMLLTMPWSLAILAGRVPVVRGAARYPPSGASPRKRAASENAAKEAAASGSLSSMGVKCGVDVQVGARMMVLTACSYLVIELPALAVAGAGGSTDTSSVAGAEGLFATIGMVLCAALFFGYLILQWRRAAHAAAAAHADAADDHDELTYHAHAEHKRLEMNRQSIANGTVSLVGLMAPELIAEARSLRKRDLTRGASRGTFKFEHVGRQGRGNEE